MTASDKGRALAGSAALISSEIQSQNTSPIAAWNAARGILPSETVAIATLDDAGRFIATTRTAEVADKGIAATMAEADCWVSANPVRAGLPEGRKGTAGDVVRLACIYADLDVKPGALPTWTAAENIIADLTMMLGVAPAAVVMTGHGLQPVWRIEQEPGRTDWPDGSSSEPFRAAQALTRRWGRLVAHVASMHGGEVDPVWNLDRVLRAPGTTNRKGQPIPTELRSTSTDVLTLTRLAETLDEYAVPEVTEDTIALDEVLCPAEHWPTPARSCSYAATMVKGWAKDKPTSGGRHGWLVAQATRLAAAQRSGCLSLEDARSAQAALVERFTTRLNVGAKRDPAPGEIAGALAWGRNRAAAMTHDRARAELGGHTHPDEHPVESYAPAPLAAVEELTAQWFGPGYDLDVMRATLAVAAGSLYLDDAPAWLLICSGSGATKSETMAPLADLGAVSASTLTGEAALLSATPANERAADATGGLLDELGPRGLLLLKDVTSILSMNRERRAEVLAALREIHDGSWTRTVGAEGGRRVSWKGRATVIGAVTTAWDAAHSVVSRYGDRFLIVRPNVEESEELAAAALRAAAAEGGLARMRAELTAAVGGLLQNVQPRHVELDEGREARLLAVADLVALSRTAVETDYRGDPTEAHDREVHTRLIVQLLQLYQGAVLIGMTPADAERLCIRVAADTMPPSRARVLDALLAGGESAGRTSYALARRLGEDPRTVDRILHALRLLRMVNDSDDGTRSWHLTLSTARQRALAVMAQARGYVQMPAQVLEMLQVPTTSSESRTLSDVSARPRYP
ncbi:hypothetical protein [Serinicoccus kebangsaanensis]|uniref:hypothetical protein n=1 Tax=Serinicoccus kebangsaanensis TaxID=2602069 RepID=UPI00124E3FA5|nr:hypothetical protein [Serinicoccus kebangsaanensis]